MSAKILAVIPARYASSRYPGKPLIDLGGKSMIQRVYEQAKRASLLTEVCVATDDERIMKHLLQLEYKTVMTSVNHTNGTERCLETLQLQQESYDYVINIQGDEPFIEPSQINLLASVLDGKTELATMVKKITERTLLESPNAVKVVFNADKEALLFSRSPIPHMRGIPVDQWLQHFTFYKHIGIYAYRADVLKEICALAPTPLEKAESLEQLRWLENGYKIKLVETDIETVGIDSPEDVETVKRIYHLEK